MGFMFGLLAMPGDTPKPCITVPLSTVKGADDFSWARRHKLDGDPS